jgi:hypothetical protein
MSHHRPLEPFMLIRHEDDDFDSEHDSNVIFPCAKCGLQFDTFSEFSRHKTVCGKWRNAKGVGKKSSKKKIVPNPPSLNADDSNANLDPTTVVRTSTTTWNIADPVVVKSEQSSVLSQSDLIPTTSSNFKLESFDSSSQPALAAAGANHWKCNQVLIILSC